MKQIVIGPYDAGQRLDKFLVRYLKGAEKGFLYKMLRKKNITLNEKRAEGTELLADGDRVTFFFSDETFELFRGEKNEKTSGEKNQRSVRQPEKLTPANASAGDASLVNVVYEDDQVIFINKPAGMLSQKAEAGDISLCEHLAAYLEKRPGAESLSFRVGVSNRLDRNTSGLVLAGKTLPGQQLLACMLRDRVMDKYYYCIVKGTLPRPVHSVVYWVKDEARNTVRILRDPAEGCERVEIEATPVKRLELGFSLLRVKLITGKTHQIRAQLAALGLPVLGDKKYGSSEVNRDFTARFEYPLRHQLLHAYEVIFPKAGTGISEALSPAAMEEWDKLAGHVYKAPLPLNFLKCLKFLGEDV